MLDCLLKYFDLYSATEAPFMHQQLAEWQKTQPFQGLKILHHVPVVQNTLLKIACLVASGAEVTVTNPSFLSAHSAAIDALKQDKILYIKNLASLRGSDFDLYFDCGAELYQALGSPKLGAVELTASGDQFYRAQRFLDFPVVSIDRTLTKQIETVFGSAANAHVAIKGLTGVDVIKKAWLVFGFGKIGRGLAYFCVKNKVPLVVIDINAEARSAAQALGIKTVDPNSINDLKQAFAESEVIVTATGAKAIFTTYPKNWFRGKILANMGVSDEYGPQFTVDEVLNHKLPVNFILDDPTPMKYIDPEFYAHNIAGLSLLKGEFREGINDLASSVDREIIQSWCRYHKISEQEIVQWFIQ